MLTPLSALTWDSGWLAVSAGHRLYFEQWGKRDGPVALVLHGGPGSGFGDSLRSFFDPTQWRVVAFDQRGCGRSTPSGECQANTTEDLLEDIETLRQTLSVSQWLVVGGSWGATLGLAYAVRHHSRVSGLLLRAFFWPKRAVINHFFKDQPWRKWAHQLAAGTGSAQRAAALNWWTWEMSRSGQTPPALSIQPEQLMDALCCRYKIQAHYLLHACWLNEAALGRGTSALAATPIQFIHGSADQVCPINTAQQVKKWLPGSKWHTVAGAGHDPFHPEMALAVRLALRHFRETVQLLGSG